MAVSRAHPDWFRPLCAALEKRGIPHERLDAAEGFRFPVLVKANVGGRGAGNVKYDTREALALAVAAGTVPLGVDHTVLVQEAAPLRNGHITRVETLNGW
jgi:carbamoylphosphate synthase large subunit